MNSTFNHNTQNIADQSSCLSEPLAISVIIPVHNESDIITATIHNDSDYPAYDVSVKFYEEDISDSHRAFLHNSI